MKRKKKSKLPITTAVTITHSDLDHFRFYLGRDADTEAQGELTDKGELHSSNTQRLPIKPPTKFYGGEISSKGYAEQQNKAGQLPLFDHIYDGERAKITKELESEKSAIIRVSHHGSAQFQKEEPVEPPRFAEYLAHFLPKSHRESLLGDLIESYPKLKARQGKQRAIFWAYSQVGTSMWSLWGQTIIKWGLIAWLGEMIRRFTR